MPKRAVNDCLEHDGWL